MRLHAVRPPTRCAVCHDDLGAVRVDCARCGASGHAECWADLGRCPSLACAVRARDRSPASRPGQPDAEWLLARALRAPARRARRVAAGSLSLLDLLIVTGIVGLLAAVVTANVLGPGCRRNRVVRTQVLIRELGEALEQFRRDRGSYPAALDALWTGPEPHLDVSAKDAWENPYEYRRGGDGSYEVVSYGADGAPGGQEEAVDLSSRALVDPR